MADAISVALKYETESMAMKIDQINDKLNNILTKDDTKFIKKIIIESLEEMKEKILASVIKTIEIVESEQHEMAIKNDDLKSEIEKCKAENIVLKDQIRIEEETRKEKLNDLEQYGRRNNIRISGLSHDKPNEYAQESIEGVISKVNNKLGLPLHYQDIDIAHRLGKFKAGKIRPVIVKFVRRIDKINVMRNAHKLKNTKLSINEDLTHLNQSVLASIRINGKADFSKTWSFEGKLFAKHKNGKSEQVEYKHFAKWLSMWPKEDNVMDSTNF